MTDLLEKKKSSPWMRLLIIFFILGAFGNFFTDDKDNKTKSNVVTNAPVKQELANEATPKDVAIKINWDNLTIEGFHTLLRRLNDGKNCTYWWHGSALKGTDLN